MMRKAFTLLELLTVIAIMGILGSAAVGGYQAITRGMRERAALDIAKGVVDAACNRANIDMCRTYLYVYDEILSCDTDDAAGKVCGMVIAVKGVGRFSAIDGDLLLDEFADLDQQFRAMEKDDKPLTESELESHSTKLRIFKLSEQNGEYIIVRTGGYNERTETDLEDGETHQYKKYGYKKLEGNATFAIGEEYGKEFMVVRLPDGYTFADESGRMSSDSNLGLHRVAVHMIQPDEISRSKINVTDETGFSGLTVFRRLPDGSFKQIGSTSQVKD